MRIDIKSSILKQLDSRRLAKLGEEFRRNLDVKVGFIKGDRAVSGVPMATVAATHEFGVPERGIPQRSFLRSGIHEGKAGQIKLASQYATKIVLGKASLDSGLRAIGVLVKGQVQDKINRGPFAPLSDETIDRKGSSKPLIDTAAMKQSVKFVVGPTEAVG